VEVVADAAPWESECTPPTPCASDMAAAWPVVVVASDEAVAEFCLATAALTSLTARAEPVVVLAVAELAITLRSWACDTPMLTATARRRDRGGMWCVCGQWRWAAAGCEQCSATSRA
jgi:hypothetical protein